MGVTRSYSSRPFLCALGSHTCKHTCGIQKRTGRLEISCYYGDINVYIGRHSGGGVASNRMNSLSKYKDFLLQLKTLVSYYSNKSSPDTIDTVDVSWNLGSHADSPPHKKNSQAHKIKFSGISLRWPRAPLPLAACMHMVTTL